jgi:hypothetical protein
MTSGKCAPNTLRGDQRPGVMADGRHSAKRQSAIRHTGTPEWHNPRLRLGCPGGAPTAPKKSLNSPC